MNSLVANGTAITLLVAIIGAVTGIAGMVLNARNTRATELTARATELSAQAAAATAKTEELNARINTENEKINQANMEISRNTLIQTAHEAERQEIYKKLNAFYAPLQQHLGTSEELYDLFSQNKGEEFRTLIALLSGTKFTGNDKLLLAEILKVTDEMYTLIMAQTGLVDSEELREYLWKACTHFRYIRLAYDGGLQGEPERFMNHVYPRELNGLVDSEVTRLKARLEELNNVLSAADAIKLPPVPSQQRIPPPIV